MSVDRQTIVVVLLLIGSFVVAIFVAAQFGGRTEAADSPLAPIKKFRAKPGTMLENARALVSDVPSAPSDDMPEGASSSRSARSGPVEIWGRLDGKALSNAEDIESLRVATAALQSDPPEAGIRAVRERLLTSSAGRVWLHTALIALYAKQDPPNLDRAGEAYREALNAAQTSEERDEAMYAYGRALLDNGHYAEVLSAIPRDVDAGVSGSPRALELDMLAGLAQEALGHPTEAMGTYHRVMDRIVRLEDRAAGDHVAIYRQAGLHLARLYHQLGDGRQAEELTRHMKLWLARME